MKGFINIVEMIIIVIVLFIAFSILFPGFAYRSKWSEALTILKSKDLILTADRIGKLYDYSFTALALQDFLDMTIPTNETGLIPWSEAEGTIKSKVIIACNCTGEEINNLTSWLSGLKLNGREIESTICYSNLEPVNPCRESSDVLFIWGYKNLSLYIDTLQKYLRKGNGIVEMSDIKPEDLDDDPAHTEIFGLKGGKGNIKEIAIYDEFRSNIVFCPSATLINRKPCNATDIIYTPWKYFYHIPLPLKATEAVSYIQTDGLSYSCSYINKGVFKLQANITGENEGDSVKYKFWICDSTKVYLDTDLNGNADIEVQEGDYFSIPDFHNLTRNHTFYLNYINQDMIGVSFRSEFKFTDFVKYEFGCSGGDHPGNPQRPPEKSIPKGWCEGKKPWAGYYIITPGSEDLYKILLQMDVKTTKNEPLPAVLLNVSYESRAAWVANFTEQEVGDDERLLLISLLLWASNKKAMGILLPEIKVGFKTSYINTVNKDMFEVYKFNLGLGYPF